VFSPFSDFILRIVSIQKVASLSIDVLESKKVGFWGFYEGLKVPIWCFVEIRGEADKTVFFVDAKASLSRG